MKTTRMAIALLTLVIVGIFNSGKVTAGSIDGLTFLTENYAPFNYQKDGKVQGISIDLLLDMFKQADTTKGLKDIKVLPWARGYKLAQVKKNTVLFSTTRTETREKMFKWVGPIIPTKISVIARKDRKLSIGSDKDFDKFKIGAVRDDIGELLLLKRGVNPKRIYRTNSSTNTAKMLAAGRIDMWAYEQSVAYWNLKEMGENPDDYEVVSVLEESQLYFAIQKDTDDGVVGELQASLDKVRAAQK